MLLILSNTPAAFTIHHPSSRLLVMGFYDPQTAIISPNMAQAVSESPPTVPAAQAGSDEQPWFLRATCPVLFPSHDALNISGTEDFEAYLKQDMAARYEDVKMEDAAKVDMSDAFTEVDTPPGSTATADITDGLSRAAIDNTLESKSECGEKVEKVENHPGPFVAAISSYNKPPEVPRDITNMTLTENLDLAYASANNPLVDLFNDLDHFAGVDHVRNLLRTAWAHDPLITLKIIFNSRSIHLGKASRTVFYRCAGWLAQEHPLTLICNLPWLSRPVIEKKVAKKTDYEAEMVMVEPPEPKRTGLAAFDVNNGLAHGYWKDLLNLLVLSVNGRLNCLENRHDILNVTPSRPNTGKGVVKENRQELRQERNRRAIKLFNEDAVHRALHLTVARLFANQLRADLDLFKSDDPKKKKEISLCAKWAPSTNRFHDKHTFVVTTIAELVHPQPAVSSEAEREVAIRMAREMYRKDISALRAHLAVVERHMSAKTYSNIKYERVPSIAMKNYARQFVSGDRERFEKYLDAVAKGRTKISGAVLLPSTLIRDLRNCSMRSYIHEEIMKKVVDAQWNSLVRRARDSGTLTSCIAVCDVSGSMYGPTLPDSTCPMDSAIGLSLLVAEVVEPPFGGTFITFSTRPEVVTVDVSNGLAAKREQLMSGVHGSTNFVAVFKDCILPMAIKHKVKPEDMVKRVFVFSDMHFDQAESSHDSFNSSYDRIKEQYEQAGYDMPQLIFWNLAGGRGGRAPKPVTVQHTGTVLVSGYSQGMLKVFLDGGGFEEPEEEVEQTVLQEEVADENGKEVVQVTKKPKLDPLTLVKKAVSHKAYDMLRVMD